MQTVVASTRKQYRPLVVAIGLVWLLLSATGLWMLVRYGNTPGYAEQAPAQFPTDTIIRRSEKRATLVIFVHPHCACSRASLGELERIVAESDGALKPCVVFFKPREADENWEQTDLWRTASAIPGAVVLSDADGEEACRFHVATSGHTLLYDAAGNLQFSGGITAARGHHGDNQGHSAIVSLLTEGSTACRETPVFGCPIVSDTNSRGETP